MTVIELDARFPTAIPLEAAGLLQGEVSYTEEVPIGVRWAIADAGGHSVSDAEVLVTTDMENEDVQDRIDRGERVYSVGLRDAPTPAAHVGAPVSAPVEPAETAVAETELDATGEATEVPAADVPAAEDVVTREPAAVVTPRFPHVEEAVDIMAKAHRTGQWESSQTHESLLRYLLEETYEFIDAVNEGGDIRGELSDLLLQVLFHAEIAEDFDFDDVAADFVLKMRARQPYLFDGSVADGETVDMAQQEQAWDAGRNAPRSQPATGLPALALAEEAIRRARMLGLKDSEIPLDLMAPTPGLEMQHGAEERTRRIAREFLAYLETLES